MIEALRASIKTLLEHPNELRWTVQGFGMLRCYLDPDKTYRLNIWDSEFAAPDVSTIHNHPWNFRSWIIKGVFRNVRYIETTAALATDKFVCYNEMVIKTGEVGGPVGLAPEETWLHTQPVEIYKTGDSYWQDSKEIHKSMYDDGTVTLNERKRVGDGEHARVFWPHGTEWGGVAPRAATHWEVIAITRRALRNWR
jgi:hypothetical protein